MSRMKYNARFLPHIDKWAVCSGKRYIISSACDDEDLAKERAYIENAKWYRRLSEEAFGKVCELRGGHKYDSIYKSADPNFEYGEVEYAELFC